VDVAYLKRRHVLRHVAGQPGGPGQGDPDRAGSQA
jgi:hypothetical protein